MQVPRVRRVALRLPPAATSHAPNLHPKIHNLTGGRIEPERSEHISRPRFKVTIWEPGIRTGDSIRWNPRKDVTSLATFQVLSISPMKGAQGTWKADLGRIVPDVTVCGVTYRMPSHGHLVVVEDVMPVRMAP